MSQVSRISIRVYNYPFIDTYYHYYDEVKTQHPWYFEPRIFKSRAILPKEVLEKINKYVERKLAEELSETYINVSLTFTTKVNNFIELTEILKLLNMLVKLITNPVTDPEIVAKFVKPSNGVYRESHITIPITAEEFKQLFEEMMRYDVELNSETAKLFGKEFAESVRKHNKEVRSKKSEK